MARSKVKNRYFAYFVPGGAQGVVEGWNACERVTSGVSGARYKGFASHGDALTWLKAGAAYEARPPRQKAKLHTGIYFDAGTGRGDGVEISVTDETGKNLLHQSLPKAKVNKHGKHLVPGAVTNNYGELLACLHAIAVATKMEVTRIFGDSKLVVEYWSKGIFKEKDLPKKTVSLIHKVVKARRAFEKIGGSVGRVSGDDNPADLGFH
jgi:ribonuclease HI